MSETFNTEILNNVIDYIEKHVDTQHLNIIAADMKKIELLNKVIQEAMLAYAIQNSSAISDAFQKKLQDALGKPKKQLFKIIKRKKTETPEEKEVNHILEILERDAYYSIQELQQALNEYFCSTSVTRPHQTSVSHFILTALEAYHDKILLPDIIYHTDLDKKKHALQICINKALIFYANHHDQHIENLITKLKKQIGHVRYEEQLNDFINAWLDKKKAPANKSINSIVSFKNLFPQKLSALIDREFNQFRSKQMTFGEFFSKEKSFITIVDYIQYALDRYINEVGATLKSSRQKDIDAILNIVQNTELSDDQVLKQIKKYFKTKRMSPLFISKLRRYCVESANNYKRRKKIFLKHHTKIKKSGGLLPPLENDNQKLKIPIYFFTKQLRPLDAIKAKPETFKKIMIIIHGVKDYKSSYDIFAEELRKHGYLVIHYYQHNLKDYMRFKRLQINSLRRTFRQFLTLITTRYSNASISIYSHNLSATIPLFEKLMISRLSSIKTVILESPAITTISLLPKFHKKSKSSAQETTGKNPKIIAPLSALSVFCSIPNLLYTMNKAYIALKQLIVRQDLNKTPRWLIVAGTNDHALNVRTFKHLQVKLQSQHNNSNVVISILPYSGHSLYNDPYAIEVYQYFLKILDEDLIS